MSSEKSKKTKESMTTQERMEEFFFKALSLEEEKSKGYGDAWKVGRPIGLTDNLRWITERININEKRIFRHSMDKDIKSKCWDEIKDDLLDLAVFTAFRYIKHMDKESLI